MLNVEFVPKNIAFLLHGECNLKCSYCWERENGKKWGRKLNLNEFKAIIDYFVENFWMFNYDRPWVKLGGGEAFFY